MKPEQLPAYSKGCRSVHLSKFFSKPEEIWEPKSAAQEGDWLEFRPGKGQSFEKFVAKSAVSLSPEKNVICILPLEKDIPQELLTSCKKMCKAFFSNKVRVRLLAPLPLSELKVTSRTELGFLQFKAKDILARLRSPKVRPKDAFCVAAVTRHDIYPDDGWNFCFGLASA